MAEHNLDVLVIGGGPGGYTAAIRAAQLGLEVGLAEQDALGGVCLNWGCIPTKSLLHTADVMREARSAEELGLELGEPSFNLEKVVQRSRSVASQLSGGIAHLMRKNKIVVFNGEARFVSKNIVQIGDDTVIADNVIIATGATARNLPDIEAERAQWPVVSWATQPADVVIFHPAMLHGGGDTGPGQRRRTLSLRFFGEAVHVAQRPGRQPVEATQRHGAQVHPLTRMRAAADGSPFRDPAFPKL